MDNTMKEDEKTEEEGGWEQVKILAYFCLFSEG